VCVKCAATTATTQPRVAAAAAVVVVVKMCSLCSANNVKLSVICRYPSVNDDLPPGGALTFVEGLSVKKLPAMNNSM
jgi:hypothetical protein